MKTKYMSRKFIVAICGLGLSAIALFLGNDTISLAGIALAGCFVIGESIIDKAASVKRNVTINDNVSRETSKGEKDGSKDKA